MAKKISSLPPHQGQAKLIIFAAPSGSGKSTIINSIMADGGAEELNLHFSISATSRAPRGNEQNGVEYFFLSPEEFKEKIANDEFIEYEEVYTDKTGFAETVRVSFDEQKANMEFILNMFFKAIDPTSMNQQGEDVGTRYRTGIYFTDAKDLPVIKKVFAEQQQKVDAPIVVEIEPLRNFCPASEFHQDYLDKHSDGYCHLPLSLFKEAKAARP